MGEPSQKRLVRKLDLERFLTGIKPNPSPNAELEQYTISESTAANVLYLAYLRGDIERKRVLDLGCGSGRLAMGAAFLGARTVVGIDVSKAAIETAFSNSLDSGFNDYTSWILGDIDAICAKFDTIVQNPPFGVQKRAADRRFLEKALELGYSIYSLHNHPRFDKKLILRLKASNGQPIQVEPSPFLVRLVESRQCWVEAVFALPFTIPHMFDFHTREKRKIVVDLYVIRKD